MLPTLLLATQKHHHMPEEQFEGDLLSFIIIDQTIIQATLASIETFNGTKSQFEAWTESIENTEQISDQNTIQIAFSKLTDSPLLTANRLKTRLPTLTWMEPKKDLSMQCSIFSIQYSCNPVLHTFGTRCWWISQQLLTPCEWASVQNIPHFYHV